MTTGVQPIPKTLCIPYLPQPDIVTH